MRGGKESNRIFPGVLRVRDSRRRLMFGLCLAAIFLVSGGILFGDALVERPGWFVIYWGFCFLLALLLLCLSLYDLTRLRGELRRELEDEE